MSGRFFVNLFPVLLAAGCTLFGTGSRSSAPRTASAGESIDSADAGALCWDSSGPLLCIGGTDKQCAPARGEGCVRCTCALGTANTEPRWGSGGGAWSDKNDQNLMGQPRVP
jgi:hypothetical protein